MTNKTAWFMWLMASFFYAFQYILRVMPSVMMTDITTHFHIDATLFGQFSGVYYIAYSLVHLPVGIMLDRYGPKYVMTSCILLTVVGMLPIIWAEHWVYPVLGRALIGVGSSAAILGVFKIVRLGFKERHFARMLSFSVTIGLMGAIYGSEPVSYMSHAWGYQAVIKLFMLLGLGLAIVTYFIMPSIESHASSSVFNHLKSIVKQRNVIMLCCLSGLMLGPLEGFSDVWGAAFLQKIYGFDDATAHALPSMVFLGMCFGAPVLSFIAEKTGNYLNVIAISGLMMFIVFSALVMGVLSESLMSIGFCLVGVCCAYQVLAIYKASTYVPEHLSGLTTAIVNMVIMSFGYLFHSAIGFVVTWFGGADVKQAFIYGISIIPITLGVGMLGFFFLAHKERRATNKSCVSC
jgi:MFS family permease